MLLQLIRLRRKDHKRGKTLHRYTCQSHCTVELQDLTFSGCDQLQINTGFDARKTHGLQSFPMTSVFFRPLRSIWKSAILVPGHWDFWRQTCFWHFPVFHFIWTYLKQKLINPMLKTTKQNEAPSIYNYFLNHTWML